MQKPFTFEEGTVIITLNVNNDFTVNNIIFSVDNLNIDAEKYMFDVFMFVKALALKRKNNIILPLYVRRVVETRYVDILLLIGKVENYFAMLNVWKQKYKTVCKNG